MGRLYAFEPEGTLFDDASAVRRLATRVGDDAGALVTAWRSERSKHAWARVLMGAYAPHAEVTAAALDAAIATLPATAERAARDPQLRGDLLASARRPQVFPDVAEALAALRAAGHQLAVLSDASSDELADALHACGLHPAFDAVLSSDAVDTYKPHPRAYRLLFESFERPREEVTFVACDPWHVAGAVAFGLEAVRVDRGGGSEPIAELRAGRVVCDLRALAA